jgi:hypothetical protein
MQVGGRRWQTQQRQGASHQEAGRQGGQSHRWAPPRSAATQEEAALRWQMGEGTQAALAVEYGVALSTVRRWCAAREEP